MRILFANDGSDHARLAQTFLCKFPGFREAELTLFRACQAHGLVWTNVDPASQVAMTDAVERYQESAFTVAQRENDAAADALKDKFKAVHAVTINGDPGHEILNLAKDGSFDLIVIGSRGENALKSFLLGSVARKVVTHAPCSVLVVRHYEGMSADESITAMKARGPLTAIIAFDGSEGAFKSVEKVRSFGKGAFGRIDVTCAEPLVPMPLELDPTDFPELWKEDRERIGRMLTEAVEDLDGFADEVTTHSEPGTPAWVLNNHAKDIGADLIVIGAKRHSGIERFLLGSVSYEIATTAPNSVLVVRA